MEEWSFGSADGATVRFHSRRHETNGWLAAYAVELEADGLRATAWVANPGWGFTPSRLFDELAARWADGPFASQWRAAEGELEIDATADATGHFILEFALPASTLSSVWTASVRVSVEAGRLDELADSARRFFLRRD